MGRSALPALLVAAVAWAAPGLRSPLPAAEPEPAFRELPNGLEIQDRAAGEGAEARAGATVDVHYTGWLADGTRFDSSRDRGKPLAFRLGAGMVIRGWDEGIAGMRVGGVRRLRVPPELGYGERGSPGVVPGGATLVFEIELVGLR
jgi:FKBP-type peptidyl-prolyl cis-trans isomerase FkpA